MALKKTDVWINRTMSGKGFTVRVNGVLYTGAMSTLARFVNGKIKGLSLSMVIPEEYDPSYGDPIIAGPPQ